MGHSRPRGSRGFVTRWSKSRGSHSVGDWCFLGGPARAVEPPPRAFRDRGFLDSATAVSTFRSQQIPYPRDESKRLVKRPSGWRNPSMKRSNLSRLALFGLACALMAPTTNADPVYKRTEVTFKQPVEIPGMVLMPGTYVMKLLDPYMDRNIVRFYNTQENHMYAMVFAVPDYRLTPTDHTVITFEERAHNSPQAIKEWFPAGDNWGEEFVY